VVTDGPAAYFSTLPVDSLIECLTTEGIPANISYSAGTYVCNSLFYGLMHYIEKASRDVRGGFIHIPRGSAANLAAMTMAVKLMIAHLDD
jgi:pyroglutamyl-peptidase